MLIINFYYNITITYKIFCKSNIILFYLYLVKMIDKSILTNQMVMQIYKLVLLLANWKVKKVTEFTQIFQSVMANNC